MLFRVIIATLILLDIILLGGILFISSIPNKNNKQTNFEIYIYFLTININLALLCLFILKRNNKKNEKKQELSIIIDNTNNINYINDKIDEFIENHSIFQDKVIMINHLRKDMIVIKRKELYKNLKLKLKCRDEITEEIVKDELLLLRNDLDNYKDELGRKINNLLELHNIKIFMINLNN